MENKRKITAEEVLTKIKDDGDFDRLRLKTIRKLKDDGELRDSIISMVKQSATLNRPGAESMKPRQLSDAIHQEIGNKVMSQISDGIWKILRSGDQMKSEITETVQSVYSKLSNPKINEDGGSSSRTVLIPVSGGHHGNQPVAASVNQIHVKQSGREPNEPPGLSIHDQNCNSGNNSVDQTEDRPRLVMSCNGKGKVEMGKATSIDVLEPDRALPDLPEAAKTIQSDDNVDDDPDVPPGFG